MSLGRSILMVVLGAIVVILALLQDLKQSSIDNKDLHQFIGFNAYKKDASFLRLSPLEFELLARLNDFWPKKVNKNQLLKSTQIPDLYEGAMAESYKLNLSKDFILQARRWSVWAHAGHESLLRENLAQLVGEKADFKSFLKKASCERLEDKEVVYRFYQSLQDEKDRALHRDFLKNCFDQKNVFHLWLEFEKELEAKNLPALKVLVEKLRVESLQVGNLKSREVETTYALKLFQAASEALLALQHSS